MKRYETWDKSIAKGEKKPIIQRWEYGHQLLIDPVMISNSLKSLRHGAAEKLIARAASVGVPLGEQEIRRRIQCARAYPTRAEIGHAVTDFGTWHAMIEAGFPPVEAVPEVVQLAFGDDQDDQGEAVEWEQLSLSDDIFPTTIRTGRETIPLYRATLRELHEYHARMVDMTKNYARRDEARGERLRELLAAVGGDLEVSYMEARAALGQKHPAA